jgi:hypothetical protein
MGPEVISVRMPEVGRRRRRAVPSSAALMYNVMAHQAQIHTILGCRDEQISIQPATGLGWNDMVGVVEHVIKSVAAARTSALLAEEDLALHCRCKTVATSHVLPLRCAIGGSLAVQLNARLRPS